MEDLRSCCCSLIISGAESSATTSASIARRGGGSESNGGEGIVCDVSRSTDYAAEEKAVLMKSTVRGNDQEVVTPDREIRALFVSRAWNLSISPAKNIGPSIFMIYMMGGGVFGLMFLGFAMLNTIKTLLAVNKVFDDFERAAKVKGNTLLQRIAYVAICLAFAGFFSYRAISSGTIPIGSAANQTLTINPRTSPDASSITLTNGAGFQSF